MKSTRARGFGLILLAMVGLFATHAVVVVAQDDKPAGIGAIGSKAGDILDTLFEASQNAQESYVVLLSECCPMGGVGDVLFSLPLTSPLTSPLSPHLTPPLTSPLPSHAGGTPGRRRSKIS